VAQPRRRCYDGTVMQTSIDIRREIKEARQEGRPVVALESTVIAHGLPWPQNLDAARRVEAAVREEGAIPAAVAVLSGRPTVGLGAAELETLARSADPTSDLHGRVRKAGRRDLAAAIAQRAHAATTVSGTMALAGEAGLSVFATGGIGGVHPAADGRQAFDVSGDLHELARTPMLVVCAGAKNILDLAATLEVLESLAVPVVGYGTDEFPAFYLRGSGLSCSARVESPQEAAALASAHWRLGGAGVVLAQPLPAEQALDPAAFRAALTEAEALARSQGVNGSALTPFLLAQLARLTQGRTLTANLALLEANARLAARVAVALFQQGI
jgi:pseudouridine-5'-phosphate glycosidase